MYLIKVGEEKIIGYLPLNTIEMDGFKISELKQFAPRDAIKELEQLESSKKISVSGSKKKM